ncbi:hypothetical protein [Halomonas salina]|uniref:Uncharacterized protein n=1 Tax=Halomonas salina TaxID=42565 RepID=A0ABR4WRX0_9GAMM|nr:hypothetical protein [Halomonas salina]KGE77314.1 hypothetical protein FP66_10755 [Halomonas salina]
MMPRRRKERLIALVVLATMLFAPPLLLITGRLEPGALTLYVFLAWGAVIALAAWLLEGGHRE